MAVETMNSRVILAVLLIAGLCGGRSTPAQFPGPAEPKHYAWSDAGLSPDERADTEIAQVHTGFPDAAGEPPKRLIGWARVDIAPGEQKTVTVAVDRDRLTVYDEASHSWKLVPGKYNVQVGGSSRDLPLHQEINLQ